MDRTLRSAPLPPTARLLGRPAPRLLGGRPDRAAANDSARRSMLAAAGDPLCDGEGKPLRLTFADPFPCLPPARTPGPVPQDCVYAPGSNTTSSFRLRSGDVYIYTRSAVDVFHQRGGLIETICWQGGPHGLRVQPLNAQHTFLGIYSRGLGRRCDGALEVLNPRCVLSSLGTLSRRCDETPEGGEAWPPE